MRRQREEDYWKSMTRHSEVTLIGPSLKVALTTWPTDRQIIFDKEGIDTWAKSLNSTTLQGSTVRTQGLPAFIWQETQYAMLARAVTEEDKDTTERQEREMKKAE